NNSTRNIHIFSLNSHLVFFSVHSDVHRCQRRTTKRSHRVHLCAFASTFDPPNHKTANHRARRLLFLSLSHTSTSGQGRQNEMNGLLLESVER
uniref:Uncharacterized protein n=1 Tax=Gasterosteus aculeatus TaxID=69293 RepID=G3P0Q5_GASAC